MEVKCRFERDMNHNYLVLEEEAFFETESAIDDFRERMVLENRIPGLLSMEKRMINGRKKYYYDVNQMQSLESLYEKNEMTYEGLQLILEGLVTMFHCLEQYLLEGEQIVLDPAYIYIHMETKKPCFLYVLWYEEDIRKSFLHFTDYLLTKIDHTQEKTVMLAYQIYKYTRTPNFVMENVEEIIRKSGLSEQKSDNTMQKKEITVEKPDEEPEKNVEEKIVEHKIKNDMENEKEISFHPLLKGEKESYRRKKAGFWMSMLFCICGIISYFLIYYFQFMVLPEKVRLYLFSGVILSFAAAVWFAIGMWKEQAKEELNDWQEAKSQYEDETVCLLEEEKEHYFTGMVNGEKKVIPIAQFPLTIGKKEQDSDIVIPDKTVSRKHARLEKKQGKVFLADLHSTNGTRKNGVFLEENEETQLLSGDEVSFGGTSFIYI